MLPSKSASTNNQRINHLDSTTSYHKITTLLTAKHYEMARDMESIHFISDDDSPNDDNASIRVRRQKERALMHTRVLLKYLDQKHPAMCREAKRIIRECAEQYEHEPGSLIFKMQHRLRALVGRVHWQQSEAYLNLFLAMREGAAEQQQVQSV